MQNLLQQSRIGLRILRIILTQQPPQSFQPKMGSSRGVLDDLQCFTLCQGNQIAWRAWAETSSAPSGKSSSSDLSVISHIHCRFQLLDDLNCILVTWLDPCPWTCSTKSPRYPTILRTFQAWECLSTRSDLGHRCSSPHSGESWAADPYSPEMPVTFWPPGRGLWLLTHWLLQCLAEAAVALGPTAESSASESADCLVVDLLVVEAPSCFSYYQSCSNWSSSAAGIPFVVAGSQNSSSATMQRYFGLLYLC